MRLFFAAALLIFVGCKPPMTDLYKQPKNIQAVEVICEEPTSAKLASSMLAERLGVPVYNETSGNKQVLRLTLTESDTSKWAGSLTKTWALDSAGFLLAGFLVPLPLTCTTWAAVGTTSGVGLITGIIYGPFDYHANQNQFKQVGYYRWSIKLKDVELVLRRPDGPSVVMISYRIPNFDNRAFLKPLSKEACSKEEIKKQSIKAFMDAIFDYLDKEKIPAT